MLPENIEGIVFKLIFRFLPMIEMRSSGKSKKVISLQGLDKSLKYEVIRCEKKSV